MNAIPHSSTRTNTRPDLIGLISILLHHFKVAIVRGEMDAPMLTREADRKVPNVPAQLVNLRYLGILNSNLAPPPLLEVSSRADPPASSIRLRTIASPNPVPRCRVVKNGSQILACNSADMPGPLSETKNVMA
jgi:hypothetical protein